MGETSLLPISLSYVVRILKARPVFNFSSFTASNNSFIRQLVLERAYLLVCDKTQGSLEERKGEIGFLLILLFFLSEMTLLGNFVHKFHNLQTPGKMVAAQKAHVSQFSIQVICQILVTT